MAEMADLAEGGAWAAEGDAFGEMAEAATLLAEADAVKAAQRLGLIQPLDDIVFERTQFLRSICTARFK